MDVAAPAVAVTMAMIPAATPVVPVPGMIMIVVIVAVIVHAGTPQNRSQPSARRTASKGSSGRPRMVLCSPATVSNRWMPSPSS